MNCCICKKGLDQVPLFRINAKGQPGLWACRKHLKNTDAPPVDPIVAAIVAALQSDSKDGA